MKFPEFYCCCCLLVIALLACAGCTSQPVTATPGITATPVPVTTMTPAPAGSSCSIVPCHGLDLSCSADGPQVCTMMYQMGDKCRQYARCDSSGGSCKIVTDQKFSSCKSCVEQCAAAAGQDSQAAFACEAKC